MESDKTFEEDYDFDFSQYEDDSKDDNIIIEKERSKTNLLRSKWALTKQMMEIMGELRGEIAVLASDVEAGTQDITLIKRFLGKLNEAWALIKPMQGEQAFNKIESIKTQCWEYIMGYSTKTLPREIQLYFLEYRDELYKLLAYGNLSFEVERTGGGSSAKKMIVE